MVEDARYYAMCCLKSLGSSNHANVVKATIEALRGLRRKDEILSGEVFAGMTEGANSNHDSAA